MPAASCRYLDPGPAIVVSSRAILDLANPTSPDVKSRGPAAASNSIFMDKNPNREVDAESGRDCATVRAPITGAA